MTTLQLGNEPSARHRVRRQGDSVHVDDTRIDVRDVGGGDFVVAIDGRHERLHAVAHGDTVHVQLRGRAFRIERIDPARGSGGVGGATAGASLAPMPGVVVSVQATVGQAVRQGDALLVIESMKLQMTIGAAADGIVAELPFGAGQTFSRGAVLVRTAEAGS